VRIAELERPTRLVSPADRAVDPYADPVPECPSTASGVVFQPNIWIIKVMHHTETVDAYV
jgi:hypothetical protein